MIAIVTAAGRGRRMGTMKALLPVHDVPLIVQHVEALRRWRTFVVVRPEIEAQVAALVRATIVTSTAPTQAGSLAVGVRAARLAPDELVLVTPVDLLPCKPSTIDALVAAVHDDIVAATPVHDGHGGHPILVRGHVIARGHDTSLRDLLNALGDRRARVTVDDPSVLGDFDLPSELPS